MLLYTPDEKDKSISFLALFLGTFSSKLPVFFCFLFVFWPEIYDISLSGQKRKSSPGKVVGSFILIEKAEA